MPFKYPIIIIGITISLAGNPKIKAINIVPSRPNTYAIGSKKLVNMLNIEAPST